METVDLHVEDQGTIKVATEELDRIKANQGAGGYQITEQPDGSFVLTYPDTGVQGMLKRGAGSENKGTLSTLKDTMTAFLRDEQEHREKVARLAKAFVRLVEEVDEQGNWLRRLAQAAEADRAKLDERIKALEAKLRE